MDSFEIDDDALLAMVGDESEGRDDGGASSSGGDRERSHSPQAARSPSREDSPALPSTETSKPQPRRGMATKTSSKGASKRRRQNESEDEGEASSAGSPASLGSDAMDESDSDASPADFGAASDDNPYPLEGKYKDAADKQYVLGLSQLEREQVLAEREDEAAKKRRNLQLKSLLEAKDRESSKKRKAAAADLEDDRRAARKPTRNKALEAYSRQREQAKEGDRRRAAGRSDRHRSRSAASSQDASGEDDTAYEAAKVKPKEAEAYADMSEIERIRVGRSRLARVCFYPKFEETMKGCFVRVCIGQDPQTRANVYRMAMITDVVKGKPYLVDAAPVVQPFYTDMYVMLAHGASQKSWSFMHCSDSKFQDSELNRWKIQMENDKKSRPSKSEAESTCTRIHGLLDHHLTSAEISEKLKKQNAFRHMFVQKEGTDTPKRTAHEETAEKIRLRNEKTRKQNAEDVRTALLAEKKKRAAAMKVARDRADALRKAALENNMEGGTSDSNSLAVPKNDVDALFSEGSDVSRAASPAPAVQTTSTPKSGTATPQKKGLPKFSKMALDDDIISSMDLAIDIEI